MKAHQPVTNPCGGRAQGGSSERRQGRLGPGIRAAEAGVYRRGASACRARVGPARPASTAPVLEAQESSAAAVCARAGADADYLARISSFDDEGFTF